MTNGRATKMKLKLFFLLAVTLVLTGTVVYDTASSFAQADKLASSEASYDGTNPPHAVDVAGRAIPESSATQPDKPIILAKDSADEKWGELKPESAFDHTKHETDLMNSLDGKTATTCVECHHTEQPSAPTGHEYLKRFERKEILTTTQLEASKQPVKSCRACHFQTSSEETDEFPPKSVTYPKQMAKQPSGKLTNDVAYHSRCISCHEAATKRDPKLKAPQACGECHKKIS